MPTAYAVTYIFFGTIGSAIILATLGFILLRIDRVVAFKEHEAGLGATQNLGGGWPSVASV
jgi:putative transport protein